MNVTTTNDPSTMLWKFYKYLSTNTIITNKHVIVVISIPLLDLSSNFDIFIMHNLQILYNSSERNTLSAKYDLETSLIAFNPERTKYILLNEKHVGQCSSPCIHHCSLQNPIYTVSLIKHCLVALPVRNFQTDYGWNRNVIET